MIFDGRVLSFPCTSEEGHSNLKPCAPATARHGSNDCSHPNKKFFHVDQCNFFNVVMKASFDFASSLNNEIV